MYHCKPFRGWNVPTDYFAQGAWCQGRGGTPKEMTAQNMSWVEILRSGTPKKINYSIMWQYSQITLKRRYEKPKQGQIKSAGLTRSMINILKRPLVEQLLKYRIDTLLPLPIVQSKELFSWSYTCTRHFQNKTWTQ